MSPRSDNSGTILKPDKNPPPTKPKPSENRGNSSNSGSTSITSSSSNLRETTICNQASTKISLAYGLVPHNFPIKNRSGGWWIIKPGDCKSYWFGREAKDRIYFYAESPSGEYWVPREDDSRSSPRYFCTKNDVFKYSYKHRTNGRPTSCELGSTRYGYLAGYNWSIIDRPKPISDFPCQFSSVGEYVSHKSKGGAFEQVCARDRRALYFRCRNKPDPSTDVTADEFQPGPNADPENKNCCHHLFGEDMKRLHVCGW